MTFSQVRSFQFLRWDDDIEVTQNPEIRGLFLSNIEWMFTDTRTTERYIPLSWLVWAATYHYFGPLASAYHTEGLVLHLVNSLLVFLATRGVLLRAFGATRTPADISLCAGLAAGLWAFHPMRVEVVAWVTQARFAEATMFSLLSLICYLRAANTGSSQPHQLRWYVISVTLYVISLGFYPINIGLPLVFIVLDFYPLRRMKSAGAVRNLVRASVEKLPFLAGAMLVGAMTIYGRHTARGDWSPSSWTDFTLIDRAVQACYIFAYYIWKPLIPLNLSPVYTSLLRFHPLDAAMLISVAFVVICTLSAVMLHRRFPQFAAVWFCHLALIFPVGGYFEHPHFSRDSYCYLQGALWSLVAASILLWLTARAKPILKSVLAAGVCVLILILARSSYVQATHWHDGEAFFRYILSELGSDPYQADIHWRLGQEYLIAGRPEQAVAELDQTLAAVPASPRALYYKAVALTQVADRAAKLGFRPEGITAVYLESAALCERSLIVRPMPDALEQAAIDLDRAGRPSAAADVLAKGIAYFPNAASLCIRQARILFELGREQQATQSLDRAVRIDAGLIPIRQSMLDEWNRQHR